MFIDPPKRSEMLCYSCMFSKAITPIRMECRNSPSFIEKDASDWCGSGLWRVWSERWNCWVHYYYHEGLDDSNA